MRPMTATEKILARASGIQEVRPGDTVDAQVNAAMLHENVAWITIQELYAHFPEVTIPSPERLVLILDKIPAANLKVAECQKLLREFAQRTGAPYFYEIGRGGVQHEVLVEEGHALPGEVLVGSDSHTTMCGALGCFATGIGSTEMIGVMLTGTLWFRVPPTLQIVIQGKMPDCTNGKDIILSLIGQMGTAGALYKAVEFTGPTITDLSVDSRMTLCTMVLEMGAKNGFITPDEKTLAYLKGRGKRPFQVISPDENAHYERIIPFDVNDLVPKVALPPSPGKVVPVTQAVGEKIDQAFIGSCAEGRLEDLQLAARVIKGRHVAPNCRLIIIPSSQRVYRDALKEGLLEVFIDAGAVVGIPSCGPCGQFDKGVLAARERCITTSPRNFVGRMGDPSSEVFLANAATTAASALQGSIADPREFV